MSAELLDNIGLMVSMRLDVEPTVPGYHMLRHRNDRVRRKWRKRLGPAIEDAFRRVTMDRLAWRHPLPGPDIRKLITDAS